MECRLVWHVARVNTRIMAFGEAAVQTSKANSRASRSAGLSVTC